MSCPFDKPICRTYRGESSTYELRIPWHELGGINAAFGSKFGLSLQLNDNDGAGRAASMTWGDGLEPAWSPTNFGVATLVNRFNR